MNDILLIAQRVGGPRKYASVDGDNIAGNNSSNASPTDLVLGSHKMDPETAAFIASCKEKEGATKKLPTIFKFNGEGKDVYVCGKLHKCNQSYPLFSRENRLSLIAFKNI